MVAVLGEAGAWGPPGSQAPSNPAATFDRGTLAPMPVDVLSEIEIDRPREEVAAFAADPDNATRWYENIKAAEWRTPRPLAVGSVIEFRAAFLGRSLTYSYEIRRARARPAPGDGHGRGAVPDGDDLHLGGHVSP